MVAQPDASSLPSGQRDVVVRLVELVRELRERNEQLQTALDSRIVIEQAKGMLAERLEMSPDEAFVVLRRAARHHRMNIHLLAGAVLASRETPLEIEAVLAGLRAEQSAGRGRLA